MFSGMTDLPTIDFNEPLLETGVYAIAKAKAAMKQVGPRVYELTLPNDEKRPLRYFTLGCQGGGKGQSAVAELMNRIAADPSHKPDFILILGDNFYDFGVGSADSPDFSIKFTDIYGNPTLPNIAGIPCFVILGNHDENLHKYRDLKSEQGLVRGLHQVVHTYLPDNKQTSVAEKEAFYKQESIDITTLPKWNMPHHFYSVRQGNTQIFCIDSSTYVRDYLANKNTNEINQTDWLAKEVAKAKAAGYRVQLALHHPPYTPGYRAYESDVHIYLTTNEIQQANHSLHIQTRPSYNEYLKAVFEKQQLTFDTVFTAHDHAMYFYRDNTLCQMTAGGGGGKTQKRKYFGKQNNLGCYLKHHGFAEVVCPVDSTLATEFNLHTIEGHQLQFKSDSCSPVQTFAPYVNKNDHDKISRYLAVLRKAIDEYFQFLDMQQDEKRGRFFQRNVSHGSEGVNRAHELWAFISKPVIDDYQTIVNYVASLLNWNSSFTKPSEHSLLTITTRLIKKENQKYPHDLLLPPSLSLTSALKIELP